MDKASRKLLLEAEELKSIAPLDCFLGINRLLFKMIAASMLECAYWAQDQGKRQIIGVYKRSIACDILQSVLLEYFSTLKK